MSILLESAKITQTLAAHYLAKITNLEVLQTIDSTNIYLGKKMQEIIKPPANAHICLAEKQTHGRGRMHKKWHSPFGQNIYLSITWFFPTRFSSINDLSIRIGKALTQALITMGIDKNITLKWPNDILYQNKKLAGILIDTIFKKNQGILAIIGIGLNVNMSQQAGIDIDQAWTSLADITNTFWDRNQIAATIIEHVIDACSTITEKS
jgi:BirA family transcriptional regulator, biotin operon repressor / biotin---[acetyl-CoA-carboxylase] ligase